MYLNSTSTQSNHNSWLIDFGTSYHMTPHKEWFFLYEKIDSGDVLQGDDSLTKIVQRGKVCLKLKYRRIETLPKVLHIPGLDQNLILV